MASKPWLLVASGGITAGAIAGVPGVVGYMLLVILVNLLARQGWLAIAMVACIAAVIGAARIEISAVSHIDAVVVESDRIEGVIASHPQSGPSGPRAIIEVKRAGHDDDPDSWVAAEGRVLVFFGDSAEQGIGRGDQVRLRRAVSDLADTEPGFATFVRSYDVAASANAFHLQVIERGEGRSNLLVRLRDTLTLRLETAVHGDAGALLAGFVTGDDSGLSDPTRIAFDRTNTSHITAVSGSNVVVLVTVWAFAVRSRYMQRALWAQLLLVVVIWLYVAMVGFNPGAVRAGLFASMMLPASRFGRKADPLTSLMFASAVMVLADPGYAGNIGFWLSMVASGAMVTSVARSDAGTTPGWLDAVRALLAAQIATFPVTFWAFGSWSPGSIVANLIAGPLVAAVFPMAFALGLLLVVAPWAGDIVGWIPKLGADAIISVVTSLSTEFPMIRSEAMGDQALLLLVLLCVALIAVLSVDVRRWVRRVLDAWRLSGNEIAAVMLGSGTGAFGVVVFLLLVR